MFGAVLYQVFTSIIMNLFDHAYDIKMFISVEAIFITALYFFGIFGLVLLNCRRKIKKTKVYDLLYANKKNENNVIKNFKGNVFAFVISILLLVGAVLITKSEFDNPENMSIKSIGCALGMLILGIYLFYVGVSRFIVKMYLENKNRKYYGSNMFLYRNLTSKINTMGITMGTISLMFSFILVGGNVALLMNNMLNNELEMGYPYEIMVSSADGDFSSYKKYIEENANVRGMHEYRAYYIEKTSISKAFDGTIFEDALKYRPVCVLLSSDYERLREILGYEKVSIADDEVVVHVLKTAKKYVEKFINMDGNDSVQIVGRSMRIKEVRDEDFALVGFNGYTYTIVVPDDFRELLIEEEKKLEKFVESGEIEGIDFRYKLACQTEEITNEKFYNELCDFIIEREEKITGDYNGAEQEYTVHIPLANVKTRGERMSETKSFFAIISFLAFYVALIFIMGAATLLAIQQLSDSEKYKYRYELLKKLGMDELEMNRLIFKQIFLYFVLPMIVPALVSVPIVYIVGSIFRMAVTFEEILMNIVTVFGMFGFVYGIYFIATEVQFDRNVNGE